MSAITQKHTHTCLTDLFPGLHGWAGTRKVKPIWILLKQETVSGSGISWDTCKSAPRSRQITTPAPHHSVFTGRMPFLPPNQQRQSTEGTSVHTYIHTNLYSAKNREDVQQSIDIAWRPGPQQQTRCSGWDRQTDGQTLESCIDPSSHTMRTVSKQVSNKCITVRKVATLLRELTCHMRSHSVTCHPAEVTFPPLPQPKLVLD